ncbi:S1C family serine protease [Nocardioides sp. LHG3406-4]|uniref:S1C family serine protease n=1 Tax=Nocardioides sp. LHG3406-4 TaxID=2804575 RepID=UPI003CF0A0F4
MNETPPPSFYGQSGPDENRTSAFGPAPATQPTPQREVTPRDGHRRGAGFAAAVIAASLVVGGGAGFGGAAAYDAWQGDDTSSSSTTATRTSQVVDQGSTPAEPGSVQDVASSVLPSVVKIEVVGSGSAGSGSGIVLSEDGTILTNNHVVDAAGEDGSITVAFSDGSRADATVLGTDPLTDTAVIKAQDVSGLTPATIGKSANLAVGQGVVAIGSPFGLDATVTSGIVSALARPVNVGSDDAGNTTTYPAIQTDAAINPGNSGGPLVDMTGSVIGINSSIRTASGAVQQEAGSIGLGFAIPIDEVMPIVDQMIKGDTPTHARLGIKVSDASRAQGQQPGLSGGQESQPPTGEVGARVESLTEGSTAADAGLESGDVITKVDETLIDSADDLVATIRSYRPGDKVTVTYSRDGDEHTTDLTLDSDAERADS